MVIAIVKKKKKEERGEIDASSRKLK